jgi:hypothetical protein
METAITFPFLCCSELFSLLPKFFYLFGLQQSEDSLLKILTMYFLSKCFFLPIINALLPVEVHRNSFYRPFSPCALIRNVSLSPDASIQSCIWECFYQHTCQTAIYYHNEKFCLTFVELCKTGTIQPSELVWTSVICSRKDPGKIIFFIKISKRIFFLEPISTCPSTSTDHQKQQEETSNWDMITNTAAGKYMRFVSMIKTWLFIGVSIRFFCAIRLYVFRTYD